MAWLPPEIEIDENFRYLSFTRSGVTTKSLDLGMIMSGDTPLSVKKPRRSTMEIDYMNGSIDISWQTGELHYEDRELTYVFTRFIPIWSTDSRDDINARCESAIREITEWAVLSDDKQMYDSGAGTYSNVRLFSMKTAKDFTSDYWMLTITLSFKAHPTLNYQPFPAAVYRPSTPINQGNTYDSRTFEFGPYYAYWTYDLFVSGNTELADPPIKHRELELPFADGTANRGRYYGDTVINYNCMLYVPNISNSTIMNKKCQARVEEVASWLFGITDSDEYEGIKMKGTTILHDSALGDFRLARCTGLKVSKTTSPEYWMVLFEIEFTTYPKIVR